MATAGWPNWPKGTDWRAKHLRDYLDTVPEWSGADLSRPIVPRRAERWEVRAYIGSPMRESGTHSREFDHETAARDYEMELNRKPGTYCVGVYRLDGLDDKPVVPRRVTEYGRLMWAADLGLPINTTPAYFWLGRDAEASDAGIR